VRLETPLFGVRAFDPLTFGMVPIVLVLVALMACAIPAGGRWEWILRSRYMKNDLSRTGTGHASHQAPNF
jgi:hypothetical protein